MKKALPIILILAAVGLVVFSLVRDGGEKVDDVAGTEAADEGMKSDEGSSSEAAAVETPDESKSGATDATDTGVGNPVADRDAGEGPSPDARRERPELVNVYDAEAERQARIEMAEKLYGEEGPIECETACDCPSDSGCQQPSGICVPGLFDVPCCDWEEGCRPGEACVNPDGSAGQCAE
jgi:hypothetical protein